MRRRGARLLTGLLLVNVGLEANEIVHFRNGFTLDANSHSRRGDVVEVRIGSGSLEFPAAEILTFDVLPSSAAVQASASLAAVTHEVKEVPPETLLADAALAQGVDAAFVRSVAQIESGLQQNRVSNKGAKGLMQLMPGTAKELGVDASRSEENAHGGVKYLRNLLIRYRGDSALALAAYNAGPGAVERFRGIPPYMETRRYVLSVLKEYSRQISLQKASAKPASPVSKSSSKPTATD